MAELPTDISVTTKQPIEVIVAEMGRDLKYIIKSIDELKVHQSKQDDIINDLKANCNREERWENTNDSVDDHEVRLTRIERGKCPKLAVLDNHEERIATLESTHQQDTGAQAATRSTLEYALAGVTVFEFMIIIVQFFKVA